MMEIVRDHWHYRRQIFKLANTDLAKTYRGAALGWAWAFIKPTITVLVFLFAFTVGFRSGQPVNGYPYYVWLITGIVPWFYMSDMLTGGAEAIRSYPYLVTKMKFPVSTISTFVSLSKFYVHILLLALTVLIYFIGGGRLDLYSLQLPLYMILMFVFSTAWSLLAAPLSAISKDFSSLVKSVGTPIFWLSGIMWNPDTVDNKAVEIFLILNPFTFLTSGYRDVFVNKRWFWEDPAASIVFLVVLALMVALAVRTHNRLRREIPDVL